LALVPNGRAPYAPVSVITNFIARHRDVGISKVDLDMLGRVGVSESLRPRTLASLKILDFYDEDGTVTEDFAALQRVSSEEFPKRLAQLLAHAYKPIFEVVGDVSHADPGMIDDAFRTFEPAGQRARMVQLFIGLMVYVGMMTDEALRKPGPAPRPKKLVVKKSPPVRPATKRDESEDPGAGNRADELPPPPPPAPPVTGEAAMRAKYFELLVEKAKAADGVDADLFDRIERLVGVQSAKDSQP
jgi:hypothetical protein